MTQTHIYFINNTNFPFISYKQFKVQILNSLLRDEPSLILWRGKHILQNPFAPPPTTICKSGHSASVTLKWIIRWEKIAYTASQIKNLLSVKPCMLCFIHTLLRVLPRFRGHYTKSTPHRLTRKNTKFQWSIWSLLGNILNAFLVSIDSESMKI